MSSHATVLFVCTGNYYRSRFAEAVFNHLADKRGLPLRAVSRGLMAHLAPGPLAWDTVDALRARGISLRHTADESEQLTEEALQDARVIIALKDAEHRPMFMHLFPEWTDKVVYWDMTDLPVVPASVTLPAIEQEVGRLIDSLAPGNEPPKQAAAKTPRAEPAAD